MKLPLLLASLFFSVKALDVYGGFDGVMGKTAFTAGVTINGYDENWAPRSIDFRTYVNITAPYPTEWIYSINDTTIASGTEDFCDYSEGGPGGIAIQIMRNGFGFNDDDCPFPQYTTFKNRKWTWLNGESIDLDDIFKAAVTILNALSSPDTSSADLPSSEPQAPVPSGPDPSDSARTTGMKRRRRDANLITVTLETINDCVNARFALTAKV